MGCCDVAEMTIPPPKREERKCRDVACFVLFVIFWIGMLIVFGVGLAFGDANRLVYPEDYKGDTCGTDQHDGKPRAAYPRMTEDIQEALRNGFDPTSPLDTLDSIKFYGVCLSTCPLEGEYICSYEAEAAISNVNTGSSSASREDKITYCNNNPSSSSDCELVSAYCWETPLDTRSVFFRCLPLLDVQRNETTTCVRPSGTTDPTSTSCVTKQTSTSTRTREAAQENFLWDKMSEAGATFDRLWGDIKTSWWVIILVGVLFSLALSFAISFVLSKRAIVTCLVWTMIVAIHLLMLGFTLYLYARAGVITSDDFQRAFNKAETQVGANTTFEVENVWPDELVASQDYQTQYRIAAFIFTVLFFVTIIVTVAMRQRIRIMIAIIVSGSKAMLDMPLMIVFPLTNVLGLTALLCYWLPVSALLASMGDLSSARILNTTDSYTGNSSTLSNAVRSLDDMPVSRALWTYHLFGLLWTNQVIQGVAIMTIASTVGQWYFSNDEDKKDLKTAVFRWYATTLKTMFGTACAGGFLIALAQLIRIIFEYLKRRLLAANREFDSRIVRCVMCCISCCLRCVEKCLKYIIRNAYIVAGIWNRSFCTSAMSAFSAIAANVGLFAFLEVLVRVLFLICKLSVAASCGLLGLAIFNSMDDLSSVWLPTALTMGAAWAMASAFFYVFDISIDTVTMCFVKDTEHQYAPQELADALGVVRREGEDKYGKGEEEEDSGKGDSRVTTTGTAVEMGPQ